MGLCGGVGGFRWGMGRRRRTGTGVVGGLLGLILLILLLRGGSRQVRALGLLARVGVGVGVGVGAVRGRGGCQGRGVGGWVVGWRAGSLLRTG